MAAVANPNMTQISESSPTASSANKKDSVPPSGEGFKDPMPPSTQSASEDGKESGSDQSDSKPGTGSDPDKNGSNHLMEMNPFEAQFGTGSSDGPPRNPLPGFPTLTSPAPGGSNTPTWRQGPLSPAILSGGGSGSGDYFSDHHFRGGIPTPKESSLRSGLTPASSTAGGFEFPPANNSGKVATSGPGNNSQVSVSIQTEQDQSSNQSPASRHNKSFSSHEAKAAANGLFLLAQSNRPGHPSSRPQISSPLVSTSYYSNQRNGPDEQMPGFPDDVRSPSNQSPSFPDSQFTDPQLEAATKTPVTGKGKKMTPGTNGSRSEAPDSASSSRRRGNDESPSSARRQKRQKTADDMADSPPMEGDDSLDSLMDDFSGSESKSKSGGAKGSQSRMTDEEKRRNFLERNRVAALKCRQRKKQWLNELQSQCNKVSTENDSMGRQVEAAKSEIVFLKSILFMHRDLLSSQWAGPSSLSQILESGLVPMSSLTGQPKPMPESDQYPYVSASHSHGGHVMGQDGLPVAPMTAQGGYSNAGFGYHSGQVGGIPGSSDPVGQAQMSPIQGEHRSPMQFSPLQQGGGGNRAPQPSGMSNGGGSGSGGSASTSGGIQSLPPPMSGLSAAIGASSGSEMPRPTGSMMSPAQSSRITDTAVAAAAVAATSAPLTG